MKAGGSISIWFFIGISLLVNGSLIFGAGIYELFHTPQAPVVLFNLHASVWWVGFWRCWAPDTVFTSRREKGVCNGNRNSRSELCPIRKR